jgi:DnaJ-class molecular chaperone
MTDAYQTLGVQRNATEADIKKAYRKMASQHHPDKGGDTAKFQEIQTAYETLTDPQKRQQHDNPRSQFDQNGNSFEFHFGGGTPEDIFSQFFGQGFAGHNPFQQRQHQPRRNKDLRVNLSVSLADTLSQQRKTISVQTTKGDRFNIDVDIPRGVSNGTTIKYSQMGDNFFETLTRGDLYVIITVASDQRFELHGINVITHLEISSIEAMIGVEKEVQGVDGNTFLIKIPAGCQYGAKFGLQGKGLYQMNANHQGDLIVNVVIKTPTLSAEQIQILKSI